MINTTSEIQYAFIVDTNKYAGNFEREMTAYCTGQVGECGVGDDEAERFVEAMNDVIYDGDPLPEVLDEYIQHRPDDNYCHRPCAITQSPDGIDESMASVAIYFFELPDDIIPIIKKRAYEYGALNNIEIKGFRLEKEIIVTTKSIEDV